MEWQFTLDQINEVAAACLQALKGKNVWAFHGQMGAGKTTFIHALCEVLGVKAAVGSPTFAIINEYTYDCEGTPKALFHMDLYRIRDEEEAVRTGVEDALYSGCLCLVEWPEKAPGLFPDDTVHLCIEATGTQTRRLKITDI